VDHAQKLEGIWHLFVFKQNIDGDINFNFTAMSEKHCLV